MDKYQVNWFPHIMYSIPDEAKINKISMYTIALEGWRRGLKLKFFNAIEDGNQVIRYSLSSKERIHFFNGSSGDKVSQEAFDICDSKSLTNEYLERAGVPVPKGQTFLENVSNEDIVNSLQNLSFPVVVKPVNGKAGKGVMANINTKEDLLLALHYVRDTLGYKDVIVQEFVQGEEVRVYVLDGKVLAAANRRPANIVGDGRHTIRELILIKNELRKIIPHLHFRPIKLDREVKQMIEKVGYTYESIPKKGERIYLRKISNVSRGGDPIDITDELTDAQKQVAIDATKAIPGLAHCGVDMIINSRDNNPVILELNTRPGIGSHLFPVEGKARDIAKEIIDFYFPETKNISTSKSKIYFDFDGIVRALRASLINEIEVTPYPDIKIHAIYYLIKSDLELKEYYLWLKRLIHKQNFYGFIQKVNNNKFELVLAAEKIEKLNNFRRVWENKERFNIQVLQTKEWKYPIKLGFYLENGYHSMRTRNLKMLLNEKKTNLTMMEKEISRFNKLIDHILNSRSWKISSPLRKISRIFKDN